MATFVHIPGSVLRPCRGRSERTVCSATREWRPEGLLSQIVKEKEAKIGELEQLVKARPDHPLALRVNFTDAYSSPGNLYKALRRRDGRLAVVGEMKRLHPRDAGEEPEEVVDYDERSIRAVSSAVAEWGCDAGMVWTDSRYGGNLNHLVSARKAVKTPLVCADFIIHPLQLAEASLSGADAVLLVAGACLPDLEELLNMATLMGLECIVEVHTEVELALAIDAGASILYCSNLDRRTNTLVRLLFAAPKAAQACVRLTQVPCHLSNFTCRIWRRRRSSALTCLTLSSRWREAESRQQASVGISWRPASMRSSWAERSSIRVTDRASSTRFAAGKWTCR